jgi:hypothetical protein
MALGVASILTTESWNLGLDVSGVIWDRGLLTGVSVRQVTACEHSGSPDQVRIIRAGTFSGRSY